MFYKDYVIFIRYNVCHLIKGEFFYGNITGTGIFKVLPNYLLFIHVDYRGL
jgi:hypothetical protein